MKNNSVVLIAVIGAAASLSAAEPDLSKLPPASTKSGLTYAKEIHAIFETSCFRCHGADRHKGDLRLDSLEGVLKGGEHGKVIIPGDSAKSPLVHAVARLEEKKAMPPSPRNGPGGRASGPGARPGGQRNGGNSANTTNAPARRDGRAGQPPGPAGPPPKPLTAEQVGLIRAWIDQGAK